MAFLNDYCIFDEVTEGLHGQLTGLVCEQEPLIEKFFRDECVLHDSQLLSRTYCFHIDTKGADYVVKKEAVAGFCVSCSNVATKLIPKSTRNKINRKIPYEKQRDHYPAVMIGQLCVFDGFAETHCGDELMLAVKFWACDLARQIGARYLIVDAVNKPKVLEYYKRNGFLFVFPDVESECLYMNLPVDEEPRTRFMLFDLMPIFKELEF